ncbi:MAG: glycoside hydrolase family 9 protein [Cyanobacteria bacterium P01_F01_bin.4]
MVCFPGKTKLAKVISGVALLALLPGCRADFLLGRGNASEQSLPEVSQVYAVSRDMIALRFDAGRVVYGEQMPYRPEANDQIRETKRPLATWLSRDNQSVGYLVGADQAILFTLDQFIEQPLDRRWLQQPQSYQITAVSSGATAYASTASVDRSGVIEPTDVFYKSKPTDMALGPKAPNLLGPVAHTVYLKLSQALTAGQQYQISFPEAPFSPVTFHYDPKVSHSEAVHVSHLGFRPDDPAKIGYLSTWLGSGGGLAYPVGLSFWLVDEATDQSVYQGKTELSVAQSTPEDIRDRNYNGTDVYRMDFSDFDEAGDYRLCVEQIGCSFAFEIGNDVWADAFYVSARGFYHQRSGIALSEPHTDYYQPRSFHPDDGVEVFQAEVSLMETNMGLGDRNAFDALAETRTDKIVPNAWGGYFDAGDWDRRIQHLDAARRLLELVDFFPEYFQTVDLNLPESNNALPDVLDEALWGLDFFRRLQTEDGGIRGGIESAKHPKRGEASWQESLAVMAYAPDPWSSYIYAGVAAQAARILKKYDPALANTYQDSALQAMGYAERSWANLDAETLDLLHHDVADRRNLAAVELYRLTQDERWHQLFLETTAFNQPVEAAYVWKSHHQREAAFIYAGLSNLPLDSAVQQNARQAVLNDADTMVKGSQKSGFNWTKTLPDTPIGAGNSFGTPQAMPLLKAHHLTGDASYLRAAILASQFSAGANPDNMIYTTGLGHRSPQHPLILNQRVTQQSPPPGITVYGPLDALNFEDYWIFSQLGNTVFPDIYEMPTAESYLDVFLYPAATEFTTDHTIALTAYTWGYLAARDDLAD